MYGAVERVHGRKFQILGGWTPWSFREGGSFAGDCLILSSMSGAVAAVSGRGVSRRGRAVFASRWERIEADTGRRAAGGVGERLAPKIAYQVRFLSPPPRHP